MSYLINNQQKLNDIIFANRNKNYGAYILRSSYGSTIFKSLSLMSLGIGSVMLIAFYLSNKNNDDPDMASGQLIMPDSVYVVPFKKEPDEELTEKKKEIEPKKPEDTKTTSENPYKKILDSVEVEKKPSVVENISLALSTNTVGDASPAEVSPGTALAKPGGNEFGTGTEPKQDFEVDSLPEFDGGLRALSRFIATHLSYPRQAAEEGKGGTVHIKFVVDENGRVGNLNLQNKLGYGLDEEALRVVGLIPKFKKPAKSKGRAVKMYFTVPIRFESR